MHIGGCLDAVGTGMWRSNLLGSSLVKASCNEPGDFFCFLVYMRLYFPWNKIWRLIHIDSQILLKQPQFTGPLQKSILDFPKAE